jgi:phosphoglycolate phosphatase
VLPRFDLIVFDWDGTLADSTPTIARCIQHAAADLGLPVPDRERASHVIGLGLADALAHAVPSLPPGRALEFAAAYRRHYLAAEEHIDLFDGVPEFLGALVATGKPLAIATGKTHAGLQRALAATGLAPHFRATRCADQTSPKPHPAMLFELAAELGVDPQRMLMIGDTTHDLQMAAAARAHAVAMTYGAHPRDALALHGPLAMFGAIVELERWLLP